ncbi:hypothetical protein [Flavobacterium sp.]|uniref:hypothetical protein n=1 Tax=Flavobacterium sp. TaxID=239 RepID=UPI00260DBB4A|nr:hypothetical protein [Flavobacterium sp.]MDD2987198.1 hypothetical protein [Flavobacterium sp.]
MKKISFLFAVMITTVVSAQWSPTGTSLTSNIFRSGSVGVGYTTTPSFGTNKFLVNGNSYFSGNLGIGTTTPSEKVDINGNITAKQALFFNSAPNGTNYATWADRFRASIALTAGTKLFDQGVPYGVFSIYDFPDNPSDAYTPNPTVFLNVSDRAAKTRLRFYAEQGDETGFRINGKNSDVVFRIFDSGNDNDVYLDMPKSNSRVVIAGWGDYLPQHKLVVRGSSMIEGNILTDSNIGIGTSNFTDGTDSYRLSVNGAVRANRVRVYTDWADYVFEKDYYLPTLEEVENHINEKGHLIDIPSASEVEEKGIELGEMNKLLLQKIEELTLYIITLNKEVEQLKEQIKK